MSNGLEENDRPVERAAGKALGENGRIPYQDLLERLPVGAYTCDCEGLITYFNEAAVKIWGRAPKLNDPVDHYCGPFQQFAADGTPVAHDESWMALALKTGKEWNGQEIVIERPDGTRIWALAHASPIRDHEGQLVGAVNVLVDDSHRRQADETQA